MEYTIDNGSFHAQFAFDDVEKENAATGSDGRRERFLRARYGDKPIIYPPMPAGSMEYHPTS